MPPENMKPSELWLKLCEMPAPSEVMDFPRRDAKGKWVGKIRMMVLDCEQIDLCRLRALERFRNMPRAEKGDEEGYMGKEIIADLTARELLAQACHSEHAYNADTEPDNPKYLRIFMLPEHLDKLRRDELVSLFFAYQLVQRKYGPIEGELSGHEVDAWIKTLVEGGSALPLAQLGSEAQVKLIQFLAVRVYSLSATLSRQYSQLPRPLVSALETWGIDTSFFGVPHPDSASDGTTASDAIAPIDLPRKPDVTIEEAIDAARALNPLIQP